MAREGGDTEVVESVAVIAGAGLSRAISGSMPLTDELGRSAAARAGIADSRWTAGKITFEAWLSRLAEPQPDLDDAQNLRNRSDFVRLSTAVAVADTLVEVEAQVRSAAPPAWLHRLIGLLHVTRTPLVTFNYDTLVEAAVQSHELTDWDSDPRYSRISAGDVLDHVPPLPPGRWGPEIHSSFRLLKLHGSLDWWWSPGDQTAATLVRAPMFGGFGVAAQVTDAHLARQLVGKTRFIVPPMAMKSTYYTNPVTRDLWRRAGSAIAGADRVVLLGYSLPLTDLAVGGMLVDHINAEASVTIVNREPAPVREALERIGVDRDRIEEVGGDNAIPVFVSEWERQAAETLAAALPLDENLPVVAAWSQTHAAAVIDVSLAGDAAVVVTEPPSPDLDPFRPRQGDSTPPVRVDALRAVAGNARALRIRWHSGIEQPVVSTASVKRSEGHADMWRALVPAGGPLEAGYRPLEK